MRKLNKISVILCLDKPGAGMKITVESLIGQSYCDFEVLVFYDTNAGVTLHEIQAYGDQRFRYIPVNFEKHNGNNFGISSARCKYLCFIKLGDVFAMNRLQRQFTFLEKNPNIDIAGGLVGSLSPKEKYDIKSLLIRGMHKEVLVNLLAGNCFVMSSLMFRKDFLRSNYLRFKNEHPDIAEYDFLTRCAIKGSIRRLNIEVIIGTPVADKERVDDSNCDIVRLRQLQNFHIKPSPADVLLHLDLMNFRLLTIDRFKLGIGWFKKLWKKNLKHKYYDATYLSILFFNILSILSLKREGNSQSGGFNQALGGWSIENSVINFISATINTGDTITEFGSGYGTARLLLNYSVRSVEHNPLYAFKRSVNHDCFYCPISKGWYKRAPVKKALLHDSKLLLIDGPPGNLREGLLQNLDLFQEIRCPVIFDDVNRKKDFEVMEFFCRELGFEYQVVGGEKKKFAVCTRKIQ